MILGSARRESGQLGKTGQLPGRRQPIGRQRPRQPAAIGSHGLPLGPENFSARPAESPSGALSIAVNNLTLFGQAGAMTCTEWIAETPTTKGSLDLGSNQASTGYVQVQPPFNR